MESYKALQCHGLYEYGTCDLIIGTINRSIFIDRQYVVIVFFS